MAWHRRQFDLQGLIARGQGDVPADPAAARGERNKGCRHYVVETRFLRRLDDELRAIVDPLFIAA